MLEQKGFYDTTSSDGFEFKRQTIFKCQYSEGSKTLDVDTEFLHFEDGSGGVLFHISTLRWQPPNESLPLEGSELLRIQDNIKKVVASWRVTNARFDVDD